ncbi:hypothetical protein BGZ60DRAFT_414872 [Tricladium varicosporioides]|nr:hypothetical protein BGZ60DRAFT_414872 [Hymenoscyphus varicosporioides]
MVFCVARVIGTLPSLWISLIYGVHFVGIEGTSVVFGVARVIGTLLSLRGSLIYSIRFVGIETSPVVKTRCI